MANKGKFFSWFGKGKKQKEQQSAEQEQSQLQQTEEQIEAQQSQIEPSKTEQTVEQSVDELVAVAVEPTETAKNQDTTEQPANVDQSTETIEQTESEQIQPEQIQPEQTVQQQETPATPEEPVKKSGFFSRFSKSDDKSTDEQPKEKKEGFFARLKKGLSKTKQNLGSGIANLFRGKKIDDDLFEELETQLLVADVGVETSLKLVESLTDHASRKQLKDGEALYELLKQEMAELLVAVDKPLVPENPHGPYVILMVGVNGVGKTTTIGKMAKQFQQQGKSVMLAAGDTFRAAAVEQLTVWGERNDIPVIAQHTGADSASVIFDAIQAAKSREIDVIIADTAGRLQNKDNLMEELKKIVRVMKKLDDSAPNEVMLTLDAGTGQNALSQVKLFSEAVGLTGLTLSKLDGTAKGGVVFAIADKFKIPIRYIGVGEGIDDLRTFNSKDFIEALFAHDEVKEETKGEENL